MNRVFKMLAFALAGVSVMACSSPKKMAEDAANVVVTCEPQVLEVVGGKIDAEVTVVCPADYFHPKAILEVTPVIVYEGGESAMEPFMYQGEKVQDNYKVIAKDGATVKERVSFDYVPGMEQSHLELRGVVKFKNKTYETPVIKVADGANTTYMLASKLAKVDYMPDAYKEIIEETEEAQIMYTINNSTVRNSELRKQEVKDWNAALEAIKSDERREITGTDIIAYASPDGPEDFNTTLAEKRANTADKAYEKITKKNPIDAPVNVQNVSEDWEGFQELVSASNIEDKDLILRVLSMYSDPAVREREIKNMSSVYKTLAKDILPQLRRARLIANIEFTNYSNEELIALINDNIDILDEEALLRAASITDELDGKATIYSQAIEKYNSERAQYNLAVVRYYQGDMKAAGKELAKVGNQECCFVKNFKGALALADGNCEEAAGLFKAANNQTSKENLAIIDIYSGDYAAALAKLEGTDNHNLKIVYILNDRLDDASKAITCECPYSAYLKAIIAARKGDAEAVKANLAKVESNDELAARAAKDIEFAQYR
ncbi:MAG: hypothetical protein IAC87_00805 [Muribaculum sp.]|jgi:hypothetical protein|uniref:Tetratricopeptide repeat protein n=1 Tax=Candidatus Merdivivens faecigallinarum TaxID=2840871 RepID=A0A9D9NPK1_9BACT|nr:hypothetical protein [Candidatus Merdivivens faecigallinarum]